MHIIDFDFNIIYILCSLVDENEFIEPENKSRKCTIKSSNDWYNTSIQLLYLYVFSKICKIKGHR